MGRTWTSPTAAEIAAKRAAVEKEAREAREAREATDKPAAETKAANPK